jgi:iron-sulfur cluster assembly accessory protein
MTVGTFNPASAITVTEAASEHFRQQLGSSGGAIRLSIKESGCTGYMYVIDKVDGPEAEDIDVALDNGVHVYVEREALPVVQGTEIDLAQEGVNKTLAFNNPNVADQCGCGESFSIEPTDKY